ncbi:hypothetical protein B2J93_905 [Marssonina coronariae]|uniref:Uncharacterized protein n=1 Tax=Diplocarpon coronariae TaxID=2795749 RepID=A0A218ZCN1_9HELO|nr:hypothetical protein B2J93_905 [Marssonina coronariae]
MPSLPSAARPSPRIQTAAFACETRRRPPRGFVVSGHERTSGCRRGERGWSQPTLGIGIGVGIGTGIGIGIGIGVGIGIGIGIGHGGGNRDGHGERASSGRGIA